MAELVWRHPTQDVELWCGDGAAALAELRGVRAVITDPPYGVLTRADIVKPRDRRSGHGGHIRRSAEWEVEGDELDALMARLFAASAAAVVDGWVHVFCADRRLSDWITLGEAFGLRYRLAYAWCKTNPAPRVRCAQWQSALELATVFSVGRAAFRDNWPNWFIAPFEPGARRWHETQKSLEVLTWLVERYTEPGELVVDPFAGSGQILRACLATGRRCRAIELDAARCEVARLDGRLWRQIPEALLLPGEEAEP